jgi:hypothetical protein
MESDGRVEGQAEIAHYLCAVEQEDARRRENPGRFVLA